MKNFLAPVVVLLVAACSRSPEPSALSVIPTVPHAASATATVTMTLVHPNKFETGSSKYSYFIFAGLRPQEIQLTASVKGAYTYQLLSNEPKKIKIERIKGMANTFKLTPLDDAKSITLTAKAIPATGATLKATANLHIGSVYYVANYDVSNVQVYVSWSTTPVETITDGISSPVTLALDSHGNLYVANSDATLNGGSITKYHLGHLSAARTIAKITSPLPAQGTSLAIDGMGNIYCACHYGQEVDEFTPSGGSTPSRRLTSSNSPMGISHPISVAVDAKGYLYVANYDSDKIGISIFAPGTSKVPVRNITRGIFSVSKLAFDRAGNLYAENDNGTMVINEFAPGGSKAISVFGSSVHPTVSFSLFVDRSGSVYATNDDATLTAFQYAAASPAAPKRVFPNVNFGYSIWADPLGIVYISSYNTGEVDLYPPGSSTTPIATLTGANGVSAPTYVLSWP